jgi:hypothetical protein
MYRETIEHPWSIPPQIKQFGPQQRQRPRANLAARAQMDSSPDGRVGWVMGTAELVATLEHSNGWHRETASRLLFERQDKSAVPLVEATF